MNRLASHLLACFFARALVAPVMAEEEIRLVVFGETELVRPGQFERIIQEANLPRRHFVTSIGDMIKDHADDELRIHSEWRRFLKQIKPLSMPSFPVPGSHDVGTSQWHNVYSEI